MRQKTIIWWLFVADMLVSEMTLSFRLMTDTDQDPGISVCRASYIRLLWHYNLSIAGNNGLASHKNVRKDAVTCSIPAISKKLTLSKGAQAQLQLGQGMSSYS